MPIEIKMPALSPTMEEGKLAKWLVKEGDTVASGDLIAEIETDKATMEFEAVDEGTIASITVAEGSEGIKVGTTIAVLAGEGDDPGDIETSKAVASPQRTATPSHDKQQEPQEAEKPSPLVEAQESTKSDKERIVASPLARRLAAQKGIDLANLKGSGPNGRIIKADIETVEPRAAASPDKPVAVGMVNETRDLLDDRVPHTVQKLSGMRKIIAKRLAQSAQQSPHIYLTIDVRLDKLLAMRSEVNATLEKRDIKISVNDMLIKALGMALIDVPECNVTFAGTELIRYSRADVSVAVSIPGGLITPIVQDANGKSLSEIAVATKDLAARAKEGKLESREYQGGTASISNMGMMGIKQFTAIINPPQSTILAIGAGEKRPWVMEDGGLGVATVMSATGSFDHRAVDGADGARLMTAFRDYVESPLGMVA